MSNLLKKIWRNYPEFLDIKKEESDLSNVTESLLREIEEVTNNVDDLKQVAYLSSTYDEWLDIFGGVYGVKRLPDETDDDYRERIIWELVRPKQTISGIKELVQRYESIFGREITVDQVFVYEPYLQLELLDELATTDFTILYDYDYWTWGVIDVKIHYVINDYTIENIEQLTKACGIKVYYTYSPKYFIDFSELYGDFWYSNIRYSVYNISPWHWHITDDFGPFDGGLVIIHDFTYISHYYIARPNIYVVGTYGYGEDGYGDPPFGGSSISYESTTIDGDGSFTSVYINTEGEGNKTKAEAGSEIVVEINTEGEGNKTKAEAGSEIVVEINTEGDGEVI